MVVSANGLDLFIKDFHLLGDFFDFFCGRWIGSGTSRTVYEFALEKKFVIKIQRQDDENVRCFQNVNEFEAYFNLKHQHPKLAAFLAPATNISSCGRILMMEQTSPIKDKQKMPKSIPAFLSDTKIQNWGILPNGKVVCHDYANTNIFSKINNKMVTPKWWSDSYQDKFKIK